MPTLNALSRQRHATQGWKRYTHYAFAAQDAIAVLVAPELAQAMLCMPIAFFAHEGAYVPVAVQGVRPDKNLFVAADGRWVGGYVPAVYRSYPFSLAKAPDGDQVLCVNEDSGLLVELAADAGAQAFFAADGQPSPAVAEVLQFLTQVAAHRQGTERMCAALHKHQLIQPWPIALQHAQGESKLEGLFRIDEAALNQLPGEALVELRDVGALAMAYCQLLSMQQLRLLGALAQAHAKADSAAAAAAAPALPVKGKELDLSFMDGSGTFKFS